MKATLNLDDQLMMAAMEATGETDKAKVIHLALQALVRRKAAERLAALGGIAPYTTTTTTIPRQRTSDQ